ncbi:hypothetical protein [Haloarcula sp. H-GB5]
MVSDSEEDEFSPPNQSLSGQVAGVIEQFCVVGARISMPLFLPIGGLLFVYLLGGYALIELGLWPPVYEFFSPTEDVYFAWLGFLTGLVICFDTGSLIGLASSTGVKAESTMRSPF